MKKYKNLILIVAAIVFVAAAVLTFIIWQSLKLSNDLQNNPDTQTTQQNDKNYNLEDKDTSWDSDNSALSSDSSRDSDKKKDERTTEKKGNGSGNDATTDKTPGTIAPIDQSNGTTNVDNTIACSTAQLAAVNNQITAIDQDIQKRRSAALAEGQRINNLIANQNTAQQGQNELAAYKASHGNRTPQEEADAIYNQGQVQKETVMQNASIAGC